MQVLQYQNRGAHLNIYECFHIYAEYINKNHLNDEHTIFLNKLFDTLLKPHNPLKKPHPLGSSSGHTHHHHHHHHTIFNPANTTVIPFGRMHRTLNTHIC
jgi:hypothetical protein